MADDVKPALTAEEWAKVDAFTDHGLHRSLLAGGFNVEYAPSWFRGIAERGASDPHARAALALHGQPFGFDDEDRALLYLLAHPLFSARYGYGWPRDFTLPHVEDEDC